jgi:hypothetical protein
VTAAELITQAEALGLRLIADGDRLGVRPKERLTSDLVEVLRAHKPELIELLTLDAWPQESRDAVQRFGVVHARLYPLLGQKVSTPMGRGSLVQVFGSHSSVVLDADPSRAVFFRWEEVMP